ncbi:MAG TPA: hypothetical protein PLY04_00075 [bacterium]|nr:hypothetical protein [bacterium]
MVGNEPATGLPNRSTAAGANLRVRPYFPRFRPYSRGKHAGLPLHVRPHYRREFCFPIHHTISGFVVSNDVFIIIALPYRRGTACRAPATIVCDQHDPMKMIRHNHPFIQFDIYKMIGHFDPTLLNPFPGIIQFHFSVSNFPEQKHAVLGAQVHEIGAQL